MSDKLKSALEIAMEKYGFQNDAETELTDEQKKKIAEIRSFYQSKKAELEIYKQENIKKLSLTDPAKYNDEKDKIEQNYVQERARLEAEAEKKIQQIRQKNAQD